MDRRADAAAAVVPRLLFKESRDDRWRCRLRRILKASMGLSVGSIGSGAIARAVQGAPAACRLADLQAYLNGPRIRSELQALIEAVVVRRRGSSATVTPFTALGRWPRTWMPAHPEGCCLC
jgi:hypothetical protein